AASASAAATAGAASAATPQIQTRTRSVPTRAATYSLRSSTKVSRIRSSHSRESSSKTAVQGASGHRCSSSPNVTKVLGKKILTPAAAAASPLGKRRRAARLRRTQQRISAAQAFWQRILEELSEAPGKCDVCGGAEATEENAILFCDACDVPVHLNCYGVEAVPPGDWYCDYCQDVLRQEVAAAEAAAGEASQPAAAAAKAAMASHLPAPSSSSSSSSRGSRSTKMRPQEDLHAPFPRCCWLCPRRSGALVRTVEGPWVHVACALWTPELEVVSRGASAASLPVAASGGMRAAGEPLPGVSTRGSNRNCGSDEASKALSSDSSQGPSFQGMQSGCTAGSTHKVNNTAGDLRLLQLLLLMWDTSRGWGNTVCAAEAAKAPSASL
ncbi:PHD finger protein rhinoceros, partial [Cyclospora cayetanensis]|uniref:PHD finger protein rhinoceros n=1 Tax=Cyclospora cayetanensis TaxID=88456 RepID=A0A6P6S0Z4_9EIME